MNKNDLAGKNLQHGAVLIIALLLLLVMTLLGVSAMQTTTLEEKMAGNMRDRSVAFQAAETALRDAESFIEGLANTAAFDGTNGLYGEANAEPNPHNSASWSAANSRAYSGTLPGVAAQPRYYIKHIGKVTGDGGPLNLGPGYGGRRGEGDVTLFRITVRGTGGSDTAQVILQGHYGKRF